MEHLPFHGLPIRPPLEADPRCFARRAGKMAGQSGQRPNSGGSSRVRGQDVRLLFRPCQTAERSPEFFQRAVLHILGCSCLCLMVPDPLLLVSYFCAHRGGCWIFVT